MALGETDKEMLKRVTPSRQVVDLRILNGTLSTEKGFRVEVEKLSGGQRLPLVFPLVPIYLGEKARDFVTNQGLREKELTLPSNLYSSNTYNNHPELRGPMEEIILAYEKERIKHGFKREIISGRDWSESFKKRYEGLRDFPLTRAESEEPEDEEELHELPIKGSKVA